MIMRAIALLAALATTLVACAEPPPSGKPRDQMTQRERDSTIAISGLPGAIVVKRGMSVSDNEAQRVRMLDSAAAEN